ncbi:acyl-CoA carboxylase subunit epsilon [Actinoplanes sp. NBRC 103695]|uniref:acyl-CoA carboxylase subunit epsilon n=1 Tax=Actinoplanes sp. NBRC 103695 TaxID=3032202 RepID=UPI00255685E6|nr:acyl-CoA carboxylase subunit epsilon [Actinoplanes sp. NBRC 103695]
MDAEPQVSVARGTPTAEELAALVAVVTLRERRAAVYAVSHSPRSEWARSARPVKRPSSWRASGVVHRTL